ncbi:MAG TPA: hypothetical protein VGI81_28265 [Tepidisphaeraceae bacterium]|jgi:hypothetical protein
MQSRQLGRSDVKVSPVIFGAWAIGGRMWGATEEKDAIDAIRASIDHVANWRTNAGARNFTLTEDERTRDPFGVRRAVAGDEREMKLNS